MKRAVVVGALGAALLALAPTSSAATTEAQMKDNVFLPGEIRIAPGDTVRWTNKGRSPHNVWYGDNSKKGPNVEPGQTYSLTFDTAMTVYFYCSLHSAGPGSGMAGVVVVGAGGPVIGAPKDPKLGLSLGPQVLRVPSQHRTIQGAVNAAKPGDVVLVSPGVYKEAIKVTKPDITIRGLDRNTTIVDGEFTRAINFLVQGANNVVIENITARYATLNNFYWTDVDGFRGSFLTSYNSGDYGIYSFGSQHGVFEDSWASGSRDSGFYIGQCKPCHQVIRRVKATDSGLGYSGTNAGGDLVITDSEWWDNYGGGITPNSLESEENPPQQDLVITNNYVHDNDNTSAPYKDPIFAAVYGMGIAIAGGVDNVVTNNRVENERYFGIVVFPIPGFSVPPTGTVFMPIGNRVEGNKVSGSGLADLALGAPAGTNNCFANNAFGTSLPVAVESLYACGGPGSQAGGGDPVVSGVLVSNVARASSGELPPGDWKTQPIPPAQPNMANPEVVTFRPIGAPGAADATTAAGTATARTGAPLPYVPVGLALLLIAALAALHTVPDRIGRSGVRLDGNGRGGGR